jgi:hypothetical protein
VRERIRADRPAARRPAWVLPLAAGIALAVLSPLVLRNRPSPDMAPAERPSLGMEQPAAPANAPETFAPVPRDKRRVDSADAGAAAPPRALARARAPQREAADAQGARDAFAPAPAAPDPAAARANESDGAAAESAAPEALAAGALADAPQAVTASRDERESLGATGRLREQSAPPALKKAEASRQGAAAPGAEERKKAATPDEARAVLETWRRFAAEHPSGPRADDGRVGFIEAAEEVFRLTRDEGDRAIAERAARAYLDRADAVQAARVREVLRRLER